MSMEITPSREARSHREMRQAVGRQLTRFFLCCFASLLLGIGIGYFVIRGQLQIQHGLVGQLQREVRALTSDIQRMEFASTRNANRFEATISRLDAAQRLSLVSEFGATQERLATLERLVQHQIEADSSCQEIILAEFSPYREQQFIPFDKVETSVTRTLQSRTGELQLLVSEIRSQIAYEQGRREMLDRHWAMQGSTPTNSTGIVRTRLEGTLPGFPYSRPMTSAGKDVPPLDLPRTAAADPAPGLVPPPAQAETAASQTVLSSLDTVPAAIANTAVTPSAPQTTGHFVHPETQVASTAVADSTAGQATPPARRAPRILSFASGRQPKQEPVEPAPLPETSQATPAPVTRTTLPSPSQPTPRWQPASNPVQVERLRPQ